MLEKISVGLNSYRDFFFSSQILRIKFLNCCSSFWELEQVGRIFKDAQHVCALGKLRWDRDRQKLCGAEVLLF